MKDELLNQIASAFGDIRRPSRVTKRVAQALDDEWALSVERWVELYTQDRETHWSQLTDADIEEYCFVLPWLDDEALLFYLPSFMSYCLRRFPDEGHRAICDTQQACTDLTRHHLFKPGQLDCVRAFTRLYAGTST